MSQEYIALMESVAEGSTVFSNLSSLVSLAAYVFCALSLYTIAQRRGIKNAWLAWVPVINVWILGSISDQYRYVAKGEVKNKRKVLLTTAIINAVLAIVMVVVVIVMIVSVAMGVSQGAGEDELLQKALGLAVGMLVLLVPMLIVSIVQIVFYLMALYDVYTSCEPANNVLYLVLSMIPGIGSICEPLFLFLCREKDGGMPPRKAPDTDLPAEN